MPKVRTTLGLLLLAGAFAVPWGEASASTPTVAPKVAPKVVIVNGGVPATTANVVVPMAFPVIGRVSWRDTYLSCRGTRCNRRHLGQDLIGKKMTPLVAAFDGRVTYLQRGSVPTKTNYVSIRSLDGRWTVNYIHVNNDTPGTDDGRGTARYGFLPGLHVGQYVVRGQFLAYMGDSGDAEDSVPHLHVELHQGDAWSGMAYNPKPSLDAAQRLSAPVTASTHPAGTLIRVGAGPVYRVTSSATRVLVPAPILAILGRTAKDAISVTAREESYYHLVGVEPLPSGLVVADQHWMLWASVSGRRYHVWSTWLRSVGLTAAAVRRVNDADLAGMPVGVGAAPSALREGALVRAASGPVYRVVNGRLRVVTTFYRSATGIAASQVAVLSPAALLAHAAPLSVAPIAPDGTVVCTGSNGARWVVLGGVAHSAQDATFLTQYGFGGLPCVRASERELRGNIAVGAPVYS